MKEATGELNMTVVTVVAIAAVAAFFYAFVWPAIQNSIKASTYCSQAVNCNSDGTKCHYMNEDGSESDKTINCKSYFDRANNSKTNGQQNGQ